MFSEYQGVKVRDGILGQQDGNVVDEVIAGDCYRTVLRETLGEGEHVVDVGAHIGSFTHLWRKKNPLAECVCVEACPENIALLRENVGTFAEVIHAAMTYDRDVVLLNSVHDHGTATGGSAVLARSQMGASTYGHLYWLDDRPLPTITLEEVLARRQWETIHVLKLDCEGSEFSILENARCLETSVWFICGEYHGFERWEDLRRRRFADWHYGHMHAAHDLGIFHLANPRFLKG